MKTHVGSTQDLKPGAWIVNPNDRGRKSLKNGKNVYLKDGQSFEIELFNPLKESVLADIKINSKSVSETGLVIKPGQRFYLDCFIDDKKKFIFKTYEVENTSESKDAISNNGMIDVFFYKEETVYLNNWRQRFQPYFVKPYWIDPYYPYVYYQNPYYVLTTSNRNSISNSGSINSPLVNNNVFTTNNITGNYEGLKGGSSTISINNLSSTTTSTAYNSAYTNSNLSGSSCYHVNSNIETGMVEKGDTSSQQFSYADMEFEKYYISHVSYLILPESRKPIETKEIKAFCEGCGKKLKGKENFCSQCGCKLK